METEYLIKELTDARCGKELNQKEKEVLDLLVNASPFTFTEADVNEALNTMYGEGEPSREGAKILWAALYVMEFCIPYKG